VEDETGRVKRVRVTADNVEHARRLTEHAMRELRAEPHTVRDVQYTRVRQYTPAIPVRCSFGGPLDLRGVAKSCVNALSLHLSPQTILEGPFQQIREYELPHGKRTRR